MDEREVEGHDRGARRVVQAASSHFDHEAAAYEHGRRYRRLARPRACALGSLRLTPTDRLLDVGCGTGEALRELAPQIASATGIDIAPRMIDVARERAQEQANLEFVVADSAHLPFRDGAFTVAFCSFSFHHYPQPALSLREIARVLGGGGRLVLADVSSDDWRIRLVDPLARRREPGHVHFYRSEELRHLLEEAGFAPVTIHRPHAAWFMIATAVKHDATR